MKLKNDIVVEGRAGVLQGTERKGYQNNHPLPGGMRLASDRKPSGNSRGPPLPRPFTSKYKERTGPKMRINSRELEESRGNPEYYPGAGHRLLTKKAN